MEILTTFISGVIAALGAILAVLTTERNRLKTAFVAGILIGVAGCGIVFSVVVTPPIPPTPTPTPPIPMPPSATPTATATVTVVIPVTPTATTAAASILSPIPSWLVLPPTAIAYMESVSTLDGQVTVTLTEAGTQFATFQINAKSGSIRLTPEPDRIGIDMEKGGTTRFSINGTKLILISLSLTPRTAYSTGAAQIMIVRAPQ